jgi:glycosidase
MTQVVIIAKSTYVWLDQLSKKYGRPITRIDQIPDEELDILARWGFTGLWLIGVWERSPASRKIKHICGNPEALASAYSIYDYEISNELGGEAAFRNLKDRAWARGIRLGTDIVPNHMGIYSKWVIEHPERFMQLDHLPFPSYRFTGPALSDDPRVSIQIEDGYWRRLDAAVVFRRRDRWTGDTKYVYHGNDGTSMPWNDTAQLDFMREDAREAVIQLILGVARHFQIIRFDAAMTLAKRHFQRLWFPHPGSGGGIPSRAERGMLKDDFDKLMPHEFWREVVDRINKEMPDTLLLAEAFWLMEGYFVRTLGMHRVYNSAFMNMLKLEENDKYRSVVKNVLEFDPRILKRFVNFMNNPDEQTAVDQFGAGDKYFGVCLMMVTMPGLPMFGHGQIEGFHEKYGMEYRRAYWNETPDWSLVRRHEAEIFPLMRKRHLFSGVEHFVLYDFYTPEGRVNENVFAYSNRSGDERALIVYHNKYEETSGWIRTSCGMAVDYEPPEKKRIAQTTLADALGIQTGSDYYYIFKDRKSGLEYIRSGSELARKGLFAPLSAFQYCIFMDFREVRDSRSGNYSKLARALGGSGVPSMDEALKELVFAPIHAPFRQLIGAEMCDTLMMDSAGAKRTFKPRVEELLSKLGTFLGVRCDAASIGNEIMAGLDALLKIEKIAHYGGPAAEYLGSGLTDMRNCWGIALAWLVTQNLGKVRGDTETESAASALMDELLLGKAISQTFQECGADAWSAAQMTTLVRILAEHHAWCDPLSETSSLKSIAGMFHEEEVRLYLNVNRYDNVLWFNKERMEHLLYWLFVVSVADALLGLRDRKGIVKAMEYRHGLVLKLLKNAEQSGWRVDRFLARLSISCT